MSLGKSSIGGEFAVLPPDRSEDGLKDVVWVFLDCGAEEFAFFVVYRDDGADRCAVVDEAFEFRLLEASIGAQHQAGLTGFEGMRRCGLNDLCATGSGGDARGVVAGRHSDLTANEHRSASWAGGFAEKAVVAPNFLLFLVGRGLGPGSGRNSGGTRRGLGSR